jgi:hypothetical protein
MSKNLHPPHKPPVRQNAVDHTKKLLTARAILNRIEPRGGNIFKRQQSLSILPLQPPDLTHT